MERTAERKRWQRTMHTPANTDDALIPFTPRHVALVRGKLADVPPKAGQCCRGVLVKQQGQDQLLHPDELSAFTKLTAGEGQGASITLRLREVDMVGRWSFRRFQVVAAMVVVEATICVWGHCCLMQHSDCWRDSTRTHLRF